MGAPGGSDHLVLADDRVTLRAWRRDDAQFLATASADPQIRRYNGPHDRHGHPDPPPTIGDAERVIDQFGDSWRHYEATGNPTGVAFAITSTASGDLLGCCGVDGWTGDDGAQFGYWIAAPARGQGHATRAAVLMARWLFGLGAARVFLTIAADNRGWAAVARRAGFEHEGTMRDHGIWKGNRHDVLIFAALETDWSR